MGQFFLGESDELVKFLSELAAMSDNLRTQALQISRLLHSFLQNAEVHSRRLPIGASMQKSQELLCILEHDFSLDSFRPARATPGLTVRQFQNRCAKLRSKCAKLQKELQLVKGEKLSGRVQKVWCLRTGLSPPNIAPQSLVELCKDFGIEHDKVISRPYITQVRDAFCEIIKKSNASELALAVRALHVPETCKTI